MRSSKLVTIFSCFIFVMGCGSSTTNSSGIGTLPAITGDNVLPITVNGSLCAANSYANKPCVSVKVCESGTTNCQTINDILVDTGSSGLRVFKSLLTIVTTPVTVNSQSIGECTQFADGTSDWGSVESADVVLGNEPPVKANIQVIDASFASAALYCAGAEQTPAAAGLNGILGVGLFSQDCGAGCSTQKNNQIYFSCSGATCTSTTIAVENQVQNPVFLLPKDNNGVIIELPTLPFGGVVSVDGYLVLGIGTQANNVPDKVTMYSADPNLGLFTTQFNGKAYSGFIDSGSNTFNFPDPATLPDCGKTNSKYAGLFCPDALATFSATNTGFSGSPTGPVSFSVGNFITLASSPNYAFVELGASSATQVTWGLPFHFGRSVFVGLEKTTSSLGTGPYWAY